MVPLTFIVLLLLGLALGTDLKATARFSASTSDTFAVQPIEYVPNRYIIRYRDDIVEDEGLHESALDAICSHVSQHLDADTQVTHRYHIHGELAGATIQLHPRRATQYIQDATPILRQAPEVAHVSKDKYLRVSTDGVIRRAGTAFQKTAQKARSTEVKTKRDVVSSPSLTSTSMTNDPRHSLTGISIQHKRGNLGKGVTVCIMDHLVDYSHPHLNGGKGDGVPCFGEGCPVIGGHDFIGANFDSVHRHPGKPNYKNVAGNVDCTHGTRIASIIAGRDPDKKYIGVAPEASIRTYGVIPCTTSPYNSSSGGTTAADAFGAYNLAYKDGCDVLSASVSFSVGWQEATSEVVSALSRKGVTSVFSVGNGGMSGPFRVGTPSIAADALAVGSVNAGTAPTFPLHIDPPLDDGTSVLNLAAGWSWTYNRTATAMPIRFTAASLKDPELLNDACAPLGDEIPKGGDYILVLFQANDCLFEDQTKHFKAKGVKFVIRVTAKDEPFGAYPAEVTADNIRHAMLSREQGLSLYRHYLKHRDVKVTFSPEGPFAFGEYSMNNTGLMSYFSAWGPDGETKLLKPDLVAVGSDGVAAASLPLRYEIAQGTSFSCPSVSGAVALYKAVHGRNVSTDTVTRALKHTATRVKRSLKPGAQDETNFRQGAGLMNITAAIDLTTEVSPIQLVYGESAQAILYNEIAVTNTAKQKVLYNISHTPAQSVYLLQKGAPQYRSDNSSAMISKVPDEADAVAKFEFNSASFELGPGENTKFSARLIPPQDDPRIIMYSGVIQIAASISTGTVRVPYTGLAGSLRTIPALVSGPTPFNTSLPALFDSDTNEQIRNDSTHWTLSSQENGSYPQLYFMMQTPTLQLTCDVVKADIVYKPTIPIIDDPTCCAAKFKDLTERDVGGKTPPVYTRFDEVPTVGRLQIRDNVPRDYFGDNLVPTGTWGTCFADSETFPIGTTTLDPASEPVRLPEGKYRVLLRALRLHAGDPRLEENWDSYLSHAYEFRKRQRAPGEGGKTP
ncbi:subtilisin-like protein [Microstroma glucosiphilum]|uniref:Subtilisin-like protein n=1 Tax=Pseudomicrostroma glucosiphilum TaxID=1684307 RepID=A0A316U1U9_9BASI|nr:subtilisin-like protein [Pseudomicrostroma glucosiphilum]PWN19342.1 subtilisin-like protein [Pseudomicrostroma glucosiphilum]